MDHGILLYRRSWGFTSMGDRMKEENGLIVIMEQICDWKGRMEDNDC